MGKSGESGIDQAEEDAGGTGIEGESHLVGGDGVGHIAPIGAQTDRNGIGLSLETPADVVGGPGKGEALRGRRTRCDAPWRERNGGGADDSERSVRQQRVGIPGEALAWAGGGERCESAAVAVRVEKFEGVRSAYGACQVGQRE